jgi:hypothetical protein
VVFQLLAKPNEKKKKKKKKKKAHKKEKEHTTSQLGVSVHMNLSIHLLGPIINFK